MMKEYKPTHPDELARQRREMPWLWDIIHDWTATVSTQIYHIGNRRGLDRPLEDAEWQKWYFHFEQKDGRGERLSWLEPREIQSTLRDGIRQSSVLLHIREGERLADVAILIYCGLFSSDPSRVLIYRCRAVGGFGFYLPELHQVEGYID